MHIAVYGAGYVGLVSAVCFAKLGHSVVCVDIDAARIAMLSKGESPIYEDGLLALLQEGLSLKTLSFTQDFSLACQEAEVHIIATGTPSLSDGSADLSQVFSVVQSLVELGQKDALMVIKSTVPVGTGDKIEAFIQEQLAKSGKKRQWDVASNPEFLREGNAIADFLEADRIVVGGGDGAIQILKALYHPLIQKGMPFLAMDRRSAELAKYAANAFLAMKISFINQMGQVAESTGANIELIAQSMRLDPRIGPLFLNAGIGYGGSCFPKDVRALVQIAENEGSSSALFRAIDAVNTQQKSWIFKHIMEHFKQQVQGLSIGFWGLAFKPNTDDLREAPSLVAIDALLQAGAKIVAYDPLAKGPAEEYLNHPNVQFCASAEAVLSSSVDALVIATEWQEFQAISLTALREALKSAPLFDGRNCFELDAVKKAKLAYYCSVGRPTLISP